MSAIFRSSNNIKTNDLALALSNLSDGVRVNTLISTNSDSGETAKIKLESNDVGRFELEKTSAPETGDDFGSNLIINSLTDEGNYKGTFVEFKRGEGTTHLYAPTYLNTLFLDTFEVDLSNTEVGDTLVFTGNKYEKLLPTTELLTQDVNQVLITGQSLASGFETFPVLSSSDSLDDNYMFLGGVNADTQAINHLVKLKEETKADKYYSNMNTHETYASGFANWVSGQTSNTHSILISNCARSGQNLNTLSQGSSSFREGLKHLKVGKISVENAGENHNFTAILMAHGQADEAAGNTSYEANLSTLIDDYQFDSGYSNTKLFIVQTSDWNAHDNKSEPTNNIPHYQLDAHRNDADITLVGPTYHLPRQADGIHLTNEGTRQLGEMFGFAYKTQVVDQNTFNPVYPTNLSAAGQVITITFSTPNNDSLNLDTTTFSDAGWFGFKVFDATDTELGIIGLQVINGNQVEITVFSGTPSYVEYAWKGTAGAGAGSTNSSRGNLRASSSFPSNHGYINYHWCVHFKENITG